MSDFTQGPWSWDGDELIADGGFPVLTAGLAKNGGRYVSVKDEDKPIIAAAPELYEALKGLLGGVLLTQKAEHYPSDDPINKAIAALAKARGEDRSLMKASDPALPLAYVEQSNPPPRPKMTDTKIRRRAAESIAKDVASWLDEDVTDDLIEQLEQTMPRGHADGFEWAMRLRDKYMWDCDASLVELLDSDPASSIEREAVRDWVIANCITPKFMVGERVLHIMGPGVVTGIYENEALYTVHTDGETWGPNQMGYLLNFEDCQAEAASLAKEGA